MEENKSPKPAGVYWIAGIFIAVGFLLLGKNLGIISNSITKVFISWQMLLIVIGIHQLTKGQRVGAVILIATGVYFMMPNLYFFNHTFLSIFFWPGILILVGLLVITTKGHSLFNRRRRYNNIGLHTKNGYINIDNNFGFTEEIFSEEVFKGGEINNSFGAVVLDLRRTLLEPGTTYLDINTSFGGIEICIPSNWVIKSELRTTFGGFEDSRFSGMGSISTDKILVLRGNISFSGVDIKS